MITIKKLLYSIFLSLFILSQVYAEDLLSINALDRLRDGVEEHYLSNGLKVIFYRRPTAPIFSAVTVVRVGGVNELPGKSGASHLFEHIAFKGSEVIGVKDPKIEEKLLPELERLQKLKSERELTVQEQDDLTAISATLEENWDIPEFTRLYRKWGSSGMNATTSKEITDYFSSFPKSSFEFWAFAESDRLLKPVMRQFYKERDVVLEERRMRYENDPSGKLYEQLLLNAFTIHPYRHPVIGYQHDIEQLTPDDVRELHRKYYVASNIVIGLVGDLDFKEISPVLEKYFGRLPSAPKPSQPSVIEPPQNGERIFSIKHNSEPQFFIGYHKPIYPNPDDATITVLMEYLLGHRIAPLYKSIVVDKKMASDLGFSEAPGSTYPNLMIIYGTPLPPYTNQDIVKEITESFANFDSYKITNNDLDVVKRGLMKEALTRLKSNIGLAGDLARVEKISGSWRAILDWNKQILSVQPEDLKRIVKLYFNNHNRTIGFLGKNEQERE